MQTLLFASLIALAKRYAPKFARESYDLWEESRDR